MEGDPDNVDSTQVAEPDRKRWNRDDVVKDMLVSCAEEAASGATKAMASVMIKDVEEREKRFVENKCMTEPLNGEVKGISQPLEGSMFDLETRMQTRGAVFEVGKTNHRARLKGG